MTTCIQGRGPARARYLKMKNSFILQQKYKSRFERWGAEKSYIILMAIFEYEETGECSLPDEYLDAFEPIKDDLDAAREKYDEICERNKRNGQNGGRPRKEADEEKPKKPSGFSGNPTKPKKPDNDNDVDIDLKKKKLNKKEKAERFNAFWEAYPKKKGKKAALKAFESLDVDDELLAKMLKALEEHIRSREWADAQYIPYPSTWLNQERWTDVLTPADFNPPNKKAGRGQQRGGPGEDMMDIGLGYVEE